jgi:DNA-directed RNA polymerase subunit alpha
MRPGLPPCRRNAESAASVRRSAGTLRRILLSSLQGVAVQSVHIDGAARVLSIAGVREDVTDTLNIKDIAIKMQGEGPKRWS